MKTKIKINKRKSKRGISALIATVLLIVITIVAIGIIWGAILPLVQEGLGTSKACGINARLEIDKTKGSTCYEQIDDSSNYSVYVEVKTPSSFPEDVELVGLKLIVHRPSGSAVFNVIEDRVTGGAPPGTMIKMFGNPGETLELPKEPGGSRVYNITLQGKPDQVGVAPIVKVGEKEYTCQETMVDIRPCSAV